MQAAAGVTIEPKGAATPAYTMNGEHSVPINDVNHAWQDGMGRFHERCTCGEHWSAWTITACTSQFVKHIEEAA